MAYLVIQCSECGNWSGHYSRGEPRNFNFMCTTSNCTFKQSLNTSKGKRMKCVEVDSAQDAKELIKRLNAQKRQYRS